MRNEINSAGNAVEHLLASFIGAIPELLGALLILIVGYIVAKVISKLIKAGLTKAELDNRVHSGQGGNTLQRAISSPTNLIAKVAFWAIMLFAISIAASTLGIPALVALVQGIYSYIPNVIAAFLIFLVAGALAGGVAGLVSRTMGDTATGKVVSTVAPVVIMSIAGFMILNQLLIAPAIVTITYAALMFGTSLALALAFGLGGREHAGRLLNGLEEKASENKTAVANDVQVGKNRAKTEAKRRNYPF